MNHCSNCSRGIVWCHRYGTHHWAGKAVLFFVVETHTGPGLSVMILHFLVCNLVLVYFASVEPPSKTPQLLPRSLPGLSCPSCYPSIHLLIRLFNPFSFLVRFIYSYYYYLSYCSSAYRLLFKNIFSAHFSEKSSRESTPSGCICTRVIDRVVSKV